MFDSLKMRLMCGVTAATVALSTLAAPVSVWADDYDDFLDYLVDITDDESDVLDDIHDHDGDGDVDEHDIDWLITIGIMEEMERQHKAEMEALKKAQAEKEKSRYVSGIWVSTTELTLTPGQTYQIIAGVKPDTAVNKGVHFYTSDWNTASVDGSGIVKANNVGSCYITAVSDEGGYRACTSVRVNPSPVAAA